MGFCTGCGHENSSDARFCAKCGAAVIQSDGEEEGTFSVGTLVGSGRYRIDKVLGVGGMGFVYKATDISLGRTVALKLLRKELTSHPTARRRMEQEARALARIEHQNVVQVRSIFEENGLLAMELEFIAGGDLGDRVEAGRVPCEEAVRLTRGILAGLQAIHDAGLVHRDVKPQNVLMTSSGVPKVTDLGVARDSEAVEKTRLGTQLGTPAYMAPEQIQGVDVDLRADIYASGIVLYELLTGQLPYEAQSDFDWAVAHVQQAPDMAALAGLCTDGIRAVIERSFAKTPEQRWQTASEMAGALEAAAASKGATAAPAGPPPQAQAQRRVVAPVAVPAQAIEKADESPPEGGQSKPVALIAAVAVSVLLLAVGAIWALTGGDTHQSTAEAAAGAHGGKPGSATAAVVVPKRREDPWCISARQLVGEWKVTSQVWRKETRGHYVASFEFSGDSSQCQLAMVVDRIGYTVKYGAMQSQPRSGRAEVQRPSQQSLGMMSSDLQLETAGKKLRVRFFFREQNGGLTGLWTYDRQSWKAGFYGPLRMTRGEGDFPRLDGIGEVSHAARCVPMYCEFAPSSLGVVTWGDCRPGFDACVSSSR